MDRILFAIIASAVLLLLGAASLYVTKTADLPKRIGVASAAGQVAWAIGKIEEGQHARPFSEAAPLE